MAGCGTVYARRITESNRKGASGMGKPTGFLEYQREDNATTGVRERIQNFNEFHGPLDTEERRKQGARCMNCGVPLCQSALKLKGMVTGCPLHNLIPEWNDEIYQNHPVYALSRLLKTSSFPEFTARVCPALCEKACICGMNDSPVTIHDNELYIIETGFAAGKMKPQIPAVRSGKKVAVIGSGPAGLAVADRLNKRGHLVTVFERDDRIGGLLMYGIPNMKLDKSVVFRRQKLMEAEGVRFVTGADIGAETAKNQEAAGAEYPVQKLLKEYDAIALCCGAKNPRALNVPEFNNTRGVHFAVDFLKSTTHALLENDGKLPEKNYGDKAYISAKNKHVVIVGGGDTGNDCVGTCIRHGCKSVTQLEMMPEPPAVRADSNPWPEWPKVLKTDYGQEEAIEVFGHDPRIYETTVKELIRKNGKLSAIRTVGVTFRNGRLEEVPGTEKTLPCELLLIAAGFLGCQPYAADSFGVELSPRSTVKTEEGHYRTNVEKIFTAGDMHRGQSLVVWAIAEGRQCAKEIDEYLMGYTNME